MERCLQEFRIRGVKTNIPFLINLVTHPTFLAGELHDAVHRRDARAVPVRRRAATGPPSCCSYLGDVIVNGNPLVEEPPDEHRAASRRPLPALDRNQPLPAGHAPEAAGAGAGEVRQWVLEQKPLLLTDTTFRDAHQSLLATRMRTYDMLAIADAYARLCPQLFSLEMWGGATFDTSMRFLKEYPWQRLAELRERIPNILFQMLLRASNAVGYTNYPGQRRAGVRQGGGRRRASTSSASSTRSTGCRTCSVAMDAVLESRRALRGRPSATPATSSIPTRPKYNLKYYVELAKELEKMGAHILAIKDMAGLCKPYAAELLVKTLQAGNRHPDPLPHARHQRRAGRRRAQGGRGRRGHRRRGHRPAVRPDRRSRT